MELLIVQLTLHVEIKSRALLHVWLEHQPLLQELVQIAMRVHGVPMELIIVLYA
jgi:hypothetical protein